VNAALVRSEARIEGVLILEPAVFEDERGFFKETYVRSKYEAIGITDDFVQDNISVSRRHVVRGLHGDPAMSKLVQVLLGEVFDVIVDARPGSPTFGKWESILLTETNHRQVYVPRGCLHGFQALSDRIVLSYKQSAEYDPEREISALWNDTALGIEWPAARDAIVSKKDQANKPFSGVAGNED
jgi:dTDP-4-dehydrorhamnose 3,5-epimerase